MSVFFETNVTLDEILGHEINFAREDDENYYIGVDFVDTSDKPGIINGRVNKILANVVFVISKGTGTIKVADFIDYGYGMYAKDSVEMKSPYEALRQLAA